MPDANGTNSQQDQQQEQQEQHHHQHHHHIFRNPHEDDNLENDKPPRESTDFDKLYRSISNDSKHDQNKAYRKNVPREDSTQIIGNPLSFFSPYEDTNERREDESDEDEDNYNVDNYDNNDYNNGYNNDYQQQPPSQDITSNMTHLKPQPDNESQSNNLSTNNLSTPASPRTRKPLSKSQTFGSFIPNFMPKSTSTLHDDQSNVGPQQPQFHSHKSSQDVKADQKQKGFKNKLFGERKRHEQRPTTYGSNIGLDDEEENSYRSTGLRAQKLISGLSLGGPSLGLMASCLLEDDRGISRAPLLLNLLGFKIIDITGNDYARNRVLRIDLEYGVGAERMVWSVQKTAADITLLHAKLKYELFKTDFGGGKTQLPKLPLPPVKKLNKSKRNKMKSNMPSLNLTVPDTDNRSIQSNSSRISRIRSRIGSITSVVSYDKHETLELRQNRNAEYRRNAEDYLRKLIEEVSLKPISNLLFIFFELSPLSALLNYERGYQGKQGLIHVSSSASSQGWRVGHFKADDLKGIYDRRTDKWMLVRDSYIMYVSDINSTTPLEVYLLDTDFKIHTKNDPFKEDNEEENLVDPNFTTVEDVKNHIHQHSQLFHGYKIYLENRERKLTINPGSSREQLAWLKSLRKMQQASEWGVKHRFDSFAPVRTNCAAQWFVDGRDYFWAVSNCIEMAKETIFIHDWWLSPELYLRRPASSNQQYRIDRLLQRKAAEGVKIFIIVYRNVGSTVATDSLYTKHSLLSLNEENIHVIRSPNQLLQNTFFWAHHEKLCIIDQTYAFLGGIDLCYGRYDTADHALTDDSELDFEYLKKNPEYNGDILSKFQIFPGKDYSNPRVKDFFELEKPYNSMYNRQTTPRMPWHDIHMFTYGSIARDLSRHFVQRWNYLIRQKRPSRLTPLLIPPPDFTPDDAKIAGYSGTCEMQLLRSSGNWSLGLQRYEQSIQNAYLSLIENSEHFVYIENQFFVTSCEIDKTEIKNRIGDALVDRIIRAHREGTKWKAIIVIPLMPGFEAQVDQAEGSSVRVIMQCQYMSISIGDTSIFAKLRRKGIDPDDYIQFFSLRKWGRIGSQRSLVTEQLYIHAKCMIADDRAVIIGSANINERSMRGVRDSEVAAVIRDTETIDTTMDGKPFKAARFAHTLRMRLMREHLGVSVDVFDVIERRFANIKKFAQTTKGLNCATNQFSNENYKVTSAMVELASREVLKQHNGTDRYISFIKVNGLDAEIVDINYEREEVDTPAPLQLPTMFNNRTGPFEANKGVRDKKKHSYDSRVQRNQEHKDDVAGKGLDQYKSILAATARVKNDEFLQDVALKTMEVNDNKPFLPVLEDVLNFLNSNDYEMFNKMDEESEQIIDERNKERWLLLKKIAYLQRVAAREQHFAEVENEKRTQTGLPPLSQTAQLSDQEISSDSNISILETKRKTTSLSDPAIKELLENVTTPAAKVSKFMDPYKFEDPLDPFFYEYLWNEHAKRNTAIYRMVFHCQPDNYVDRWSEYTRYTNLQSDFMKGQISEADGFVLNPYKDRTDGEKTDIHLANDAQHHFENEGDSEYGLLGRVPPSKEELQKQENESKIRHKLGRKMSSFAGAAEQKIDSKLDKIKDDEAKIEEDKINDNYQSNKQDEIKGNAYDSTRNSSDSNEKVRSRSNTHYQHQQPKIRKIRENGYVNRRRIMNADVVYDKATAEKLLSAIQGHLVYFPTNWLDVELNNDNWFYSTDRIPPMEIYD
ncbi:SPO14 [Candida pseudojiufengensis]|uniref:SPO14 n=1 Tax=Candida pseudojiufengensis TaxID=497109 RepID=UPI0022250D1D|nr:SPO14 [Candida pseudojiufengensis]KAI5962196.1 SPO14 [Candida pseudojiufengensis]